LQNTKVLTKGTHYYAEGLLDGKASCFTKGLEGGKQATQKEVALLLEKSNSLQLH
jgi:hypothetical protein